MCACVCVCVCGCVCVCVVGIGWGLEGWSLGAGALQIGGRHRMGHLKCLHSKYLGGINPLMPKRLLLYPYLFCTF